ncbi:cell adhesion molecule 2-like isoform X1 [Acipenser oxyrinchus oxyrinchus]|uniref:Cell adhesion molecule 2-like isoform X1 n=1 Tax=Acipenser oxyrinchus oxyrinchus TaxID=40147 RepID=A0AAD8CQX2_ACIOX|nr:cell adhesion molecule 2-like isoform X1 [Acipenser oxyrinchus oxyrinchus]
MLSKQVLLFALLVGLRAQETQPSERGIRYVYQPPLISALVGETKTVNCTFEHTESERASSKWERMTSNQTVDTVSLTCNALMTACTETMEIKNLTLQHADTYVCAVKLLNASAEKTGNGTRIIVYEKEISVEEVVVAGKEVELNCSAIGFYPEEISFTWTRGALHSAVQNNTVNHADGTFSAYSRLRFTPDSADNGVTVGCHINHSSLTETLTRLTTLNVTSSAYGNVPLNVTSSAYGNVPLNVTSCAYGNVTLNVTSYSPRSFSVAYSIDSQPPRPVEQGGIYAPEMSTLWLHCAVQSNPQSSVSWLIESISTADFKSTTSGTHLLIEGVRVEDEGTYWCMANNSNGAGNSSVAVRVKPKVAVASLPFIFIVVLTSFTVLVIIVAIINSKSQDKRNPKGHSVNSTETNHAGLETSIQPEVRYGLIYKRRKMKEPRKAEKQEVVFSEVRFVMGTPQPKARCQLPTKDLGSEDSSQTNTVCALVNLSNGPERE